jgi:hypothetical protein
VTNVILEKASVTDWAQAWLVNKRSPMVAYLVKHYPHLEVGKAEAMIDQLWNRLVDRIVKDHGLPREEAERAQARGLAFLVRSTKGKGPSSPDKEQDCGWHNFILYSLEYAALCDVLAGRFIHHLPNDVAGWPQSHQPCSDDGCRHLSSQEVKAGARCGDDLCRGIGKRQVLDNGVSCENNCRGITSQARDCTGGHTGSGGDCIKPPVREHTAQAPECGGGCDDPLTVQASA